ncbi:hypothetical protein K2173_002647 [Erythroxylum novogranatense]|uniref:Vinorine synthase-like n=1 Tax=Erythroxylum novogranatense TaxID=1862640 RepID=A0AAV8SXV8_9ROSI|nr:hypothetical protein K2173_002647 [Erythroxylum novogranatense]
MELEVKVISKDLIKPSSPTPDHLRHCRLSYLDQMMVPVLMPWVLFYPETTNSTNFERCNIVKKSLANALSLFYPLAGRVKDNSYIDCSDMGVPFFQAQANCSLSDFLRNPSPADNNKFLPFELDDVNDLTAVFQVTFFECGAMAIGFAMSHKIGDALSFFMFLNSWAAIARGDNSIKVPCFDSAEIFPPRNISGYQPSTGIVKDDIVTKRFVFDAANIEALRAEYSDRTNKLNTRYPSRVEALSTFIWSRFKAAIGGTEYASDKIFMVIHAINLRTRFNPPISEEHFGNICNIASVMSTTDTKDESFGFINQIRDAIRNVNAEHVKKLQNGSHLNDMKDTGEKIMGGNVVPFAFTSLCRFPVREADFGWGKPVWVGSARLTFRNYITFLDTKEGDGIEAWINFGKEDMELFEKDSEFIAHTSSPSLTPDCKLISVSTHLSELGLT